MVEVTVTFQGESAQLAERVFAESALEMEDLRQQAREAGALSHYFVEGDEPGVVMARDVWPDEATAMGFLGEMRGAITALAARAGVRSEPEITVRRVIPSADQIGLSDH